MSLRQIYLAVPIFLLTHGSPLLASDFRVPPYLQNPASDAMTIRWFSHSDEPGRIVYQKTSSTAQTALNSAPVPAHALDYSSWESTNFFGGTAPAPPFLHRVRLEDLEPNTVYEYTVEQNTSRFSSSFKTAPADHQALRFIAYADCETEPESTGKHTSWPQPGSNADRTYPLDQTEGYANNLEVIQNRQPQFITISGDLVESGGEQRDWDEFWRHVASEDGERSLAGRLPFLVAPGNHEYYRGPAQGGYEQPESERAIAKYLAYFESPANGAPQPAQQGRYYRLDYGPVTIIALDVANDSPHQSEGDTNFFLVGENDPGNGHAPAFSPGSSQYEWLEIQLEEAQQTSEFTFVIFHHVPYSVGPHGWPPGEGLGFDTQSGVPVRILTPLFMQYGVDAVLAGHDEMWERSEIRGTQIGADGQTVDHTIHFFDVGIGGDGLRGPEQDLVNDHQQFLAHSYAPEIWQNDILIEGGKHYGHLEVDILPLTKGGWQAVLKPVYIFPLFNSERAYLGYERRLYDDIVTLTHTRPTVISPVADQPAAVSILEEPYPNPFNSTVLLRYGLEKEASVAVKIFDLKGQCIRTLIEGDQVAGYHSLEWNARNAKGALVSSGVYLVSVTAGALRDSAKITLAR